MCRRNIQRYGGLGGGFCHIYSQKLPIWYSLCITIFTITFTQERPGLSIGKQTYIDTYNIHLSKIILGRGKFYHNIYIQKSRKVLFMYNNVHYFFFLHKRGQIFYWKTYIYLQIYVYIHLNRRFFVKRAYQRQFCHPEQDKPILLVILY